MRQKFIALLKINQKSINDDKQLKLRRMRSGKGEIEVLLVVVIVVVFNNKKNCIS